MNETAVLCFTVQNAKYPITLVSLEFYFLKIKKKECFRMLFERFVQLPDNYYVSVYYVNVLFKFLLNLILSTRQEKLKMTSMVYVLFFFLLYTFNYSISGRYLFRLLYTEN